MEHFIKNYNALVNFYFGDSFLFKVVLPIAAILVVLLCIKFILSWSFKVGTRVKELKKANKTLIEMNDTLEEMLRHQQSHMDKLNNLTKKIENIEKSMQGNIVREKAPVQEKEEEPQRVEVESVEPKLEQDTEE